MENALAWRGGQLANAFGVNCADFARFLLRAEYPVLFFSQDVFGRE
jgi:hypothetical protein